MQRLIAGILTVLFVFQGCASARSGRQANVEVGATLNEELELGRKIHNEILSTFYVYTDQSVVAYVNEIGRGLAGQADRQNLNYQFTILYNEKIYATSAPGGYVYVTTGMMNFLENEAEFAAVLAHEIAQLQYKDPRLSSLRKILTAVTETGAAVGPFFGHIGALAVLGLVMVHAVVDAGEKTPEERLIHSDARALRYLVGSGYDPQSLGDVVRKLLNADDLTVPYFYDYYQSRPISQKRMDALEEAFGGLPLEEKQLATKPRLYQEMTKGIREIYRR